MSTFSFGDDSQPTHVTSHARHRGSNTSQRTHRRGAQNSHAKKDDAQDDNKSLEGSLTYSANSSLQSGAGDSTGADSFAKIMEVLDIQDKDGISAYLKDAKEKKTRRKPPRHPSSEFDDNNVNATVENDVFFAAADSYPAGNLTPKSKNGTRGRGSPRSPFADEERRGFC